MSLVLRWLLLLLLALFFLWKVVSPPEQETPELILSAAASLTDILLPLEELAHASGDFPPLRWNLAGSGALRFQIEQGAPADIFLAANRHEPQRLREQGLVHPPVVFARGELVLAAIRTSTLQVTTPRDLLLPSFHQLGLGSPQTVPAGLYARQALERLELWNALQEQLVFGEHVRQVVHYIEAGAVDAGIVYQTDAQARPGLRTLWRFPPSSHEPIEYTAAILARSPSQNQARRFIEFLLSPKAQSLLAQAGFLPASTS